MTDLKYPLKSNTVPMISVLLPAAVFLAVYFLRRDVYDLHHAILGLLFSVLITGVITDALKDAVGRPRPDFYWRCFPDGKELYDKVTGKVICHGDRSLLKDGHKSFPSGHTSLLDNMLLLLCKGSFLSGGSFAGLGFLALYLSGKIKAFDQRGHVAKVCIVFLPLLLASLVGISRVDDYRHHWQDVFAGGLLGIVMATFCYLQFYPAPYHTDGWGPYAYFQMLSESRASGSATNAANQQPEGSNNNRFPGAYHNNRTGANDLESGRIMADIQLGTHTIKSHGIKVARLHMHDWIILLLLGVIEIILNVIDPFYRFVGKDMMTDLKYPLKSNTVPFWAVPVIGIVLPFVVIIGIYFKRRDVYDFHHAILGLLYSVLVTGVITDAIKDAVGRPRPDFFWRCFPDGKEVYDNVTTNVICHGEKSVIKEGHKSFPSGHSSWSFAGLGFLAWYLSGKIQAFDRRGHIAKLCIVFLPLLGASLVAISRVDDYWHHWQDVFAGGILGFIVASFCYLQFFPPPYDVDGWGPFAYFRMLAETRNSVQGSTNTNPRTSRPSEMETVYV
ncbi:Lipid phosphate phosphatase 2 [Cocos nucifera]|uniref:Lipid phosphate phosphatase 2 n=1 Tax=Cocos nucifera TaxID=13894 RepID=A0A8K0I2V2_COCNU|nr:Lipid phosphate phosphatase 2 [Cocos nucifera]